MNINDKVQVQLTPFGADIWNKRYDGLGMPEEEPPAKVIHGEVIEEKLWYIMKVFGPHIYNGGENTFVDCQMEIM